MVEGFATEPKFPLTVWLGSCLVLNVAKEGHPHNRLPRKSHSARMKSLSSTHMFPLQAPNPKPQATDKQDKVAVLFGPQIF